MQLYETTGQNGATTACWAGSLAEASKQRAALKKSGHMNVETHAEQIPTSKIQLLEWLNAQRIVI